MLFKCDCDMRTKLVGSGCGICNTDLAIDALYNPEELCDELKNSAFFTDDQAYYIASDVYQPLLGLISTLNDKINQLANTGDKAISEEGR